MKLFFYIAILLQNLFAFEFEAIRTQEISPNKIYPKMQEEHFTHGISLNLLHLRGSGWLYEQIEEEILNTAKILKKCQIKIEEVLLTTVESSLLDVSLVEDDNTIKDYTKDVRNILFHTPYVDTTFDIYLVRDIKQDKGKPGEDRPGAVAFPAEVFPIVKGVAFLEANVSQKVKSVSRKHKFSVLAHELGHLLKHIGHTKNRRTLMEEPVFKKRNTIIPSQMCDTFKSSDFIKEL